MAAPQKQWRIYYADGTVVRGRGKTRWRAASPNKVQVVVLMETGPEMGWTWKDAGQNHSVLDRQLWTGQDTYDPFGWGAKRGSLVSDRKYRAIWRRACTDGDN